MSAEGKENMLENVAPAAFSSASADEFSPIEDQELFTEAHDLRRVALQRILKDRYKTAINRN
jgi:hypothetical protein